MFLKCIKKHDVYVQAIGSREKILENTTIRSCAAGCYSASTDPAVVIGAIWVFEQSSSRSLLPKYRDVSLRTGCRHQCTPTTLYGPLLYDKTNLQSATGEDVEADFAHLADVDVGPYR